MNTQNIILVIFIVGITILAFYSLLKERISFKKKILFSIIRFLIALLLVISFIEPTFTISRYITPSHTLGILVDVSQSMTLFKSDSTVNKLKEKVEKRENLRRGKRRKIEWFIFGDSLRKLPIKEDIVFKDHNSLFPFNNIQTKLKNVDEFIVISDGNWTNEKMDFSTIQNKIVWYLKLPPITPLPFVSIESPDTLISYSDSVAEYNLMCKGFSQQETKLHIVLEKDGKSIYTDSLSISKGYFSYPYKLKIKNSKKGINLYKVTINNISDNIKTSVFFLHKVIPSVFKYSFYFDTPSLDMRFLKLALSGDKRFTEVESNSNGISDVIFLFSPSPYINNQKALQVFIGCGPEKNENIKILKEQKLFFNDLTIANPFFTLYNKNLPPLSEVIKIQGVTKIKPWISVVLSNDTIPIIFTGEYKKKKILVCAFRELWQWDFLPLSYERGEGDEFTFSKSFVNSVVQLLYLVQEDTFLIAPSGNIKEGKYIKCLYTLPQNNYFSYIKYECYNRDNFNILYDTLIELENSNSLFNYFFIPPLEKGNYIIKASLEEKNRTYRSNKTYRSECELEVLENNEELSIMGQNETLLKEMGKPLDLSDSVTLDFLLNSEEKETIPLSVSYSFTLKKNWWLLLSILLLFTSEWFLRKIWNLDR